jgi:predicted transcriptional regulator
MISTHGDLENTIMNAVWQIEEDEENTELIDVASIQRIINTRVQSWAYTTIKTVLDRLTEKGRLNKIKYGRKFYYNSAIGRLEMAENALRKLSMQYFKNDMTSLANTAERLSSMKELALV